MNRTARKTAAIALAAAAALFAAPAGAADVEWTVDTLTATDSSVLQTSGTPLYAYRGASTSLPLGDVTFEAGADLSTANIEFDPTFVAANVSSASDPGTLRGLAWNFGIPSGSGMDAIKLTLKGLTKNHRYLVQILAHNSYGDSMITIGDKPSVNIKTGQYATVYGSFTVDGSSYDVVFSMGGTGGARYVNAIQVRELPSDEPAGKPAVITVR